MYELMVEDTFDAAHQLRGYEGPCEKLHGHSFKVQLFIYGETLDKHGMLMDFKKIKSLLSKILKGFDHANLNELPEFQKENPTSENIAKIIFEKINDKIKLHIDRVSVWESPTTFASYLGPE